MDPFVASMLILVAFMAAFVPAAVWLLPKMDRAADRVEAWLDARKAR